MMQGTSMQSEPQSGINGAGEVVGRAARELDARQLIEALHGLRREPADATWWPRFCALVAPLARARTALITQRTRAGEDWRLLAAASPEVAERLELWREVLAALAERALRNGYAYAPMRDEAGVGRIYAAVRVGAPDDQTLLVLEIPEIERARLNELLLRVQLVADAPARSTAGEAPTGSTLAPDAAPAEARLQPVRPPVAAPAANVVSADEAAAPATGTDAALAELLDVNALVMRETRYGAAGMALVNGLMARLGCALVALGWRQEGYVRIEAISHLDRFERKTEHVNLLEAACEEAADQECDIVHAGGEGDGTLVLQAHERLRRAMGYSQICTLPLQDGGDRSQAVLLLAMDRGTLPAHALGHVHLTLGLILPWLAPLRERDRWWGARLGGWSRKRLAALLGPERPLTKLFSLLLAGLLLYALFGTQNYRVEATSQLGTDNTRLISASYDGFLNEVHASSGDTVAQGALLAALDTRELMQQEAETLADIQRFRAEAMKARAMQNLADAEIAQRRLAQVEARLERIRYSLAQSRVYAPFDGVIVEGERKDLLGAPVKKGDRLFRLARIEGLYVVLHVPEREIRHVEPGASGELTLLARPDARIAFEVETLIPVAQVKGQDGNHFVIRGRLLTPPEPWWRPGMSGVARIDAGRRNVAWIYTHKAVDALRMRFWF
jgi:hypothetical protein